MEISRRHFLAGSAALAVVTTDARAQPAGKELIPSPAQATIIPGRPPTEVWAYNGSVPGPVLRFRQGERARVVVENRLTQDTSAHWHGLRLPNAMDGVPHVTQPPIAPGGRFVYEFDLPDAGTFWYHPHASSAEQVERGLAGAFIVEEREPPAVDRDIVWVLDDWRLTQDAAIVGEFGNMMDASHAGRLGNTVTINGRVPDRFVVQAGERLRLRLINTANARVFGLEFGELAPTIVALDGHPLEPHALPAGRVVLGPGMRADLILDIAASSGAVLPVVDTFYARGRYKLVDLVVDGRRRERPLTQPVRLPPNPTAVPDLASAERIVIELGGGMMDPRLMRAVRERGGQPDPDMIRALRERMTAGQIWTLNGQSVMNHHHAPLLTLVRGRSYVFTFNNDTAWHHPMHLHGMAFRVLTRNGQAVPYGEWRDTTLLDPGERVEIGFVADNPGDWMIHCHILEHQEAGMMGTIRVI
jgi:FtsP/CotA-like multicopper oxidase with cupredoxin domain